MKQKAKKLLVFQVIFSFTFLLFFLFIGRVASSEEILSGTVSQPGFRDGLRIQYNTNTGDVIGIFEMRQTDNDDMLFGNPDPDIGHLDILTSYELLYLMENYELSHKVDIETNSIAITLKQN